MRGEGQRTEQCDNRAVADIESAGISTERGHHQALAVSGEAAARNTTAALGDARHRMQMAGDLPIDRLRRRFVTKRQSADRQLLGNTAAETARRIGIVIAGEPEPITAALQGTKRRARTLWHPRRTAAVVKTVAQRDHQCGAVAVD